MTLLKNYFFILLIFSSILFFNNFKSYDIPKPCSSINTTLQCGLDISCIVNDINGLLPQLSSFIDQFNNLVTSTNINVVTDTVGNMSIDVPLNMSDVDANNISKRLGIIDRLITTHQTNLSDLFQKGTEIENKLIKENPNYIPQLKEQAVEFKKLNSLYKHNIKE